MGLVNIPNQPLRFMSFDEIKACQNNDAYCYKAQPFDPFFAQWRQEACGSELICDVFFMDEGPELVTNGSFAADTDWTHSTSWTLAGGKACFLEDAGSLILSQSLAITPGKTYRITFTLEDYVANTLQLAFTGSSIGTYTADGTYTVDVIASGVNTLIAFASSDSFEGCITNVSVVQLSSCWEFDNDGVTFTGAPEGGICHEVGAATVITQTTPPLTALKYYRVQIVIAGRSDGSVTVTLGASGVSSEAVLTTNGINVVYLTANSTGDVTLTLSSDFNGCVKSVSIFELVNDYSIVIKDVDGNVLTTNIESFMLYQDDFVTLHISGFNGFEDADGPLPYGCYTIEITDSCDAETYESNCISYRENHPNTLMLTGDIPGTDMYGFGFKFNPFKLNQRLEFYFGSPKYPLRFDNRFYSTGQYYKSFATAEKVFEMTFAAVSEIEHDAIRVQIICPQLSVTKADDTIVYYNNRSEEYTPEYDASGVKKLTEARILVQQRTDVLKMSNL